MYLLGGQGSQICVGTFLLPLLLYLPLTLLSTFIVTWAVFEKRALNSSRNYYSVGAVGLSSVAFALQVGRWLGVARWSGNQ
jgi:hypothetical protein